MTDYYYTASIAQGHTDWDTTIDAQTPAQALQELRVSYPGLLIREIDFGGRLTLTNLYLGWRGDGIEALDEALASL